MNKAILLIALMVLTSSCGLFSETRKKGSNKSHGIQKVRLKKFNKGVKYLDAEDYKSASIVFKRLVSKSPITVFEVLSLYNLGLSYEGLKKCKSASKVFRKVVKVTKAEQQRLQAQALYHLSQAYECMGKDSKVISSLTDVLSRRNLLSKAISEAEVPARLAAAYARIGNKKMAAKYFAIAEDGLKRLSSTKSSIAKKQEVMARTLFLMGRFDIFKFTEKTSEKYLKSLEYVQRYLLKSAELDHKVWSARSAKQLILAYSRVWDFVNDISVKQKNEKLELDKRRLKLQKVSLVQMAMFNLKKLKGERFPTSDKTALVETLFVKLGRSEKKFQIYLSQNIVGNELTKENESRFGLKRKGKLRKVKSKIGDPNL